MKKVLDIVFFVWSVLVALAGLSLLPQLGYAEETTSLNPVADLAAELEATRARRIETRSNVASTLKNLSQIRVTLIARETGINIDDYVTSSKRLHAVFNRRLVELEAAIQSFPSAMNRLQRQVDELYTLRLLRDRYGVFDDRRNAVETMIAVKTEELEFSRRYVQHELQTIYQDHLRKLVDIYSPYSYRWSCETVVCMVLMQNEVENTLYVLRDSTQDIDMGEGVVLKKTKVLANEPLSGILPQLTSIWGLIEESRYQTYYSERYLPEEERKKLLDSKEYIAFNHGKGRAVLSMQIANSLAQQELDPRSDKFREKYEQAMLAEGVNPTWMITR